MWADRVVVSTRRYGVEVEFLRDDAPGTVVARVALPPAAADELADALRRPRTAQAGPARTPTRGPSAEYVLWLEGTRLARIADERPPA